MPWQAGGLEPSELPAHRSYLRQVAEGVVTTRTARELAQRSGVEMPITEQMYHVLFEDKPVPLAMRDLMGRQRRAERG